MLLIIYRIYSIFHIFLLKLYKYKKANNKILKYILLELIDNNLKYKIKKILNKIKKKG